MLLLLLFLVVGDADPGGVGVATLARLLEVERGRDWDQVTWEGGRGRGLAVIAVKLSVGVISQAL